ncbi:MAG: hypothetical protein ABL982_14440 [Vicinamibacterales bacterium]
MPAVRFSRDKRGYEYVYLVHTPTRRGKPGRTRVLYWYRTPPGVRIGRQPFDGEVQRTLEQQNPGVAFDWPAIIKAEMPPPDMTEFWRERRRQEKVARQERRAAEADEAGDAVEPDATDTAGAADPRAVEAGSTEFGAVEALADVPAVVDASPEPVSGDTEAASASPAQNKRRRRRGGRRRKGVAVSADGVEAGPTDGDAEAAGDSGPDPVDDKPSE